MEPDLVPKTGAVNFTKNAPRNTKLGPKIGATVTTALSPEEGTTSFYSLSLRLKDPNFKYLPLPVKRFVQIIFHRY